MIGPYTQRRSHHVKALWAALWKITFTTGETESFRAEGGGGGRGGGGGGGHSLHSDDRDDCRIF